MLKFVLEIILNFINYLIKKYNKSYLFKLKRFLLGITAKVIIVVEEGSWAIELVGKYISENLKNLNLINTELINPQIFKNRIIHFGSINCLITKNGLYKAHKSNKIVLTWFHISPTDKRIKLIPVINKSIDVVHTSNSITANQLNQYGFDEKKIVIIPIGIDLTAFKPFDNKKRKEIKKKYKIPKDKIIIGSFQKDGVGWGEGLEPKLIKGPDILCEVIRRIHNDFNIHIFLTGPARGYVKKKLEEYKISYTHVFFENYLDIVECYNVLDLYLVTSRIEGGPQAILEGMATGVPIVTTKVGMAPEIVKDKINGCITEVEDVDTLYLYSAEIIKNEELRKKIIKNGLKTVKNYGWEIITRSYFEKIYKKLLEN